jgi:hypothetical protein
MKSIQKRQFNGICRIVLFVKVGVDMRRYKMSKGKSRRSFTRGTRVATMNRRPRPMRGGTRL